MVGASFDTVEENAGFANENDFAFRLLSDVDRSVGARYETLRASEESSPEYAKRRTYVIDPDGIIRRAYRVTDAGPHPQQVLDDVRELVGRSG